MWTWFRAPLLTQSWYQACACGSSSCVADADVDGGGQMCTYSCMHLLLLACRPSHIKVLLDTLTRPQRASHMLPRCQPCVREVPQCTDQRRQCTTCAGIAYVYSSDARLQDVCLSPCRTGTWGAGGPAHEDTGWRPFSRAGTLSQSSHLPPPDVGCGNGPALRPASPQRAAATCGYCHG